jgi:RimJ/RimL family protein N-acetyltransferase
MEGLPPGYPSEFETDVVLADGATTHVRPIRPGDEPLLVSFHERQSPQSIYFRYFSPRPRLSERELQRMTELDYVDRMGLVALRHDELIGVARYDRWRHRSEAEVAFFVDDANHGRGLATVLLEHLAVRAREVGLTGFTASVLPENRKMIGVFTQAGFETATRFADGVVEVRLGLAPTPEAEAAIEERARAAASQAVRRLLSPRSVAVIGAGRDPGSVGHDVVRNLQRAGFQGPVWPVNPRPSTSPRCGPSRASSTSRTTSTSRSSRSPPRRWPASWRSAAASRSTAW